MKKMLVFMVLAIGLLLFVGGTDIAVLRATKKLLLPRLVLTVVASTLIIANLLPINSMFLAAIFLLLIFLIEHASVKDSSLELKFE